MDQKQPCQSSAGQKRTVFPRRRVFERSAEPHPSRLLSTTHTTPPPSSLFAHSVPSKQNKPKKDKPARLLGLLGSDAWTTIATAGSACLPAAHPGLATFQIIISSRRARLPILAPQASPCTTFIVGQSVHYYRTDGCRLPFFQTHSVDPPPPSTRRFVDRLSVLARTRHLMRGCMRRCVWTGWPILLPQLHGDGWRREDGPTPRYYFGT